MLSEEDDMTILEIVQTIIGIVGLPTAIFSVLLLARQTQQLKESIYSQVYQGVIECSLKVDELLIQYPQFRKYIYENEMVDENTPDLDRLMTIIELVVDTMDHLNVQRKYIPSEVRTSWSRYSYDILNTPAAKYFFEKYPGWFPMLLKATQMWEDDKK